MRRFTLSTLVLTTVAISALGGLVSVQSAVASDAPATVDQVQYTKLHGVSASSATDAWAVGFRQEVGGHNLALTRHWDGTSWQTVPSAHPLDYSFLWGVESLSPTDAWAVGEALGGALILPFAEHWDGTEWTVVPMKNPPGIGKLNAVSATGPDDVWMVGTGYPSPFQTPKTFIAHWDGQTLHRVRPAKLLKARSSELTSIVAVAPNDVWAVGAHGRHGQTYLPLIEHFDGESWTVVDGDQAPGTTTSVSGVDALSATDAWSVGWESPNGQPTISPLAQHWDGTSWTRSPALSRGYSSYFTSVSTVAADDVWAVGSWVKSEQDRRTRPLIEHWDGHAWSIVDAPARPGSAVSIESVSMGSPTVGFAVGESTFAARTSAYLSRWDGGSWTR